MIGEVEKTTLGSKEAFFQTVFSVALNIEALSPRRHGTPPRAAPCDTTFWEMTYNIFSEALNCDVKVEKCWESCN